MAEANPETVAEKPSFWRFQYNLRTLFILTTVFALGLGMWEWRGPLGLYLFAMGSGVAVVVAGVVLRKIWLIVLGVLVLVGIQLGLEFSYERTAVNSGSGWINMAVPFEVVDAATGKPVEGAEIRVAAGAQFTAVSRADGSARVDAKLVFISQEYKSLFGRLGKSWISFDGITAEIDAEGYEPAKVWLDDHLGRQHDVRDDALPTVRVELKRRPGWKRKK